MERRLSAIANSTILSPHSKCIWPLRSRTSDIQYVHMLAKTETENSQLHTTISMTIAQTFSPSGMRNMVDISARKPSRANQPSQHALDLITTLDPKPTQLSRQMTLKIPARDLWAILQGPTAVKHVSAKERGYVRPRPSHDVESVGLATYDKNVVDHEAEESYRPAREIWVTVDTRDTIEGKMFSLGSRFDMRSSGYGRRARCKWETVSHRRICFFFCFLAFVSTKRS